MFSCNVNDFDNLSDQIKNEGDLGVERLTIYNPNSEHFEASNLSAFNNIRRILRLHRSDSGIDRQSLLMESNQHCDYECSFGSIKKIISLSQLIRSIEKQNKISQQFCDQERTKTINITSSMPRCVHESPEENSTNSSWIHCQLVSSSIEHEKLNKLLKHFHNQIFQIENVKMYAIFNGITTDQLKDQIRQYFKIKAQLAELATGDPCNVGEMIAAVKKLEPIAESVENYLRLSHKVQNIHNQINVIVQRRHSLQNKRCELLKILRTSSYPKTKTEYSLQSTSLNNAIYPQSSNYNSEILKEIRAPFYGEYFLNDDNNTKLHDRSLCHEYVNDNIEKDTQNQCVELLISSFADHSIVIVQVKQLKLNECLETNCQYRIRLLHFGSSSSDWSTIWVSDNKAQCTLSTNILLPIKCDSASHAPIELMLELESCKKCREPSTRCFMFNVLPIRSVEKISVPLFEARDFYRNSEDKPNPLSNNGYKTRSEMNLKSKLAFDAINVPVNCANVRRSRTFNDDHRYSRKQTYSSQQIFPLQSTEATKTSSEEFESLSSGSLFKRESVFRKAFRLKRNSINEDYQIKTDQQISDYQNNHFLIDELWSIVIEVYNALKSSTSHREITFKITDFKRNLPSNLENLYEYFVDIIFGYDNEHIE